MAGIRANRQNKLHKSAIEHYRTRVAHHVKMQAQEIQRRVTKFSSSNDDDEEGGKQQTLILEKRMKELLKREKGQIRLSTATHLLQDQKAVFHTPQAMYG